MDADLKARLDAIEKKIDDVYVSAEKSRKYILWTVIITVAVVVLPLFALPFVIGQFLSTYSDLGALL